jgi:hypothetical protein
MVVAGNPREMITTAEQRFPVRIRIAVPPGELGQRHTQITAWLDENCGANGWAMTPSGAHSGDCDRPFRPKVITDSGDHVTPLGHLEGRREGRGDLRRRHECKLHSQSVLVKRQSLVQGPSGRWTALCPAGLGRQSRP